MATKTSQPPETAAAAHIAKSILDPVKFCEDILGDVLWEKQAMILRELDKPGARIAVKSCHGSGKCLGLAEPVILADGSEVPARDLPELGEFQILGYDSYDRFISSTARATFEEPQPMYRLLLAGGTQVIRSGGHRVLACKAQERPIKGPYGQLNRVIPTEVGWVPVDDLEPGMFVAAPEMVAVPKPVRVNWDRERLAFVAYMTTIGALRRPIGRQERWAVIRPYEEMARGYAQIRIQNISRRSTRFPERNLARVAVAEGMRPAFFPDEEGRRKQGHRYTLPTWVFSLPYEGRRELVKYCASFLWWHQGVGVSFRFRTYEAARLFRRLLQSIGIEGAIRYPQQNRLYRVAVTNGASLERLFGLHPPGRERAILKARTFRPALTMERFFDKDFKHLKLPVGFCWQKVKTLTAVGKQPSVCIEVDNREHALITDIVEHNSFVSARAVLWFITRFQDAIVITTAPQWEQVRSVLWAEIHQAIRHSKIRYPNVFQTSIRLGPKRFAFGLSTDEGVRFQGFRSDKVLIVMDEAPGIKGEIWDAINGIRAAGDVRVLAIGNPVLPAGRFFDIFQQKEDTTWKRYTISAFDTPNMMGMGVQDVLDMTLDQRLDNPIPFLTSRQWVYEQYHEVGPQHPYWQSRVMGEFPTEGEWSLFSLQWIDAARKREPVDQGGPVYIGVDVGGKGENETVIAVREADSLLAIHGNATADPLPWVISMLEQWRPRIREVNVDTAGMGFYFADFIRNAGFPVQYVNGGSAAWEKERFTNLRGEIYSHLAQKFRENTIHGITDPKLIDQLIGIQWKLGGTKQLFTIESKEESKKRGIKSPDRADALSLAFATNLGISEILIGRA